MKRLLSTADPRSLLDPAPFTIGATDLTHAEVIDYLAPHMTTERRARIDAVIARRAASLVTVVDGIVNAGNVSAVMRSAEAMGVLPFHVVTGDENYKHSQRTSQGAEKWLDVWRWSERRACAEYLKEKGIRLVAMHVDASAVPINAVDLSQPTAFIFGNERDGISPELLKASDERCVIPMEGFTQSFNISVAAAVSLYHARRARGERHADLTDDQAVRLRAGYYLRSVSRAEEILRRKVG